MPSLPGNSVIHVEREAGFEKVVMSHPSSQGARVVTMLIFFVLMAGILAIWGNAAGQLLDGRPGFDSIMTTLFMSLVLAVLAPMVLIICRRRVPESVMVAGNTLIYDTGVDPFRSTHLDKGERRQSAQFMRRRRVINLTRQESATLSRTDIPYRHRIYVVTNGARLDIGEALSTAERAWLYDFLATRLNLALLPLESPDPARPAAPNRRQDAQRFPRPRTQDRDSPYRVDPLEFDDPIAQRADWQPMEGSGASFTSHRLRIRHGTAAFVATVQARLFALCFPTVGLVAGALGVRVTWQAGSVGVDSVVLILIGLFFAGVGAHLVKVTFAPIRFSLGNGGFTRGWKHRVASLSEIRALQLLSYGSRGESHYTLHELNLILSGGQRVHVLAHGDATTLHGDAQTLAGFLGCRIFDGIRPLQRRQQRTLATHTGDLARAAGKMPRYPAGRVFLAAALIVASGIIIWMLHRADGSLRETGAPPQTSNADQALPSRKASEGQMVPIDTGRTGDKPQRSGNLVLPPGALTVPGHGQPPEATGHPPFDIASVHIDGVEIDTVTPYPNGSRIVGRADSLKAVAQYLRVISDSGVRAELQQVTRRKRNDIELNEFIIMTVER